MTAKQEVLSLEQRVSVVVDMMNQNKAFAEIHDKSASAALEVGDQIQWDLDYRVFQRYQVRVETIERVLRVLGFDTNGARVEG